MKRQRQDPRRLTQTPYNRPDLFSPASVTVKKIQTMKPKFASAIMFVLVALVSQVRGEEITLESARPVVMKSVQKLERTMLTPH